MTKKYMYTIISQNVKKDWAFRDWDFINEYKDEIGWSISSDNYEATYTNYIVMDANSDLDVLERLYIRFNLYKPSDFKSHSLSVADMILLQDCNTNETKLYFVDGIGFKLVKDNDKIITD